MKGAISESGGNSSLAGERKKVDPEGRVSTARWNPKGLRRSTEYRAVIKGGYVKEDEPVGPRWGKVEPALGRRRRSHSPHRTKVFAGGTVGKNRV